MWGLLFPVVAFPHCYLRLYNNLIFSCIVSSVCLSKTGTKHELINGRGLELPR